MMNNIGGGSPFGKKLATEDISLRISRQVLAESNICGGDEYPAMIVLLHTWMIKSLIQRTRVD
jgi:hypothetical protein